eukprot:3419363-Rhodomonas_salina.2
MSYHPRGAGPPTHYGGSRPRGPPQQDRRVPLPRIASRVTGPPFPGPPFMSALLPFVTLGSA